MQIPGTRRRLRQAQGIAPVGVDFRLLFGCESAERTEGEGVAAVNGKFLLLRRKLLDLEPALPKSPILSAKDLLLRITGVDVSRCPCRHEGTLIVVGDLLRLSSSPRWDSS